MSSQLGHGHGQIVFGQVPDVTPELFAALIGLSILTATCAIILMHSVSWVERLISIVRIPPIYRPLAGGAMLVPVSAFAPFALSAGHGAFQEIMTSSVAPLGIHVGMIVIKGLASAISLGCGYRGGLFFASLLIGSLIGQAYSQALGSAGIAPLADHQIVALAGMAALAAGVVGGPVTMAFLALELSASFPLTIMILGTAVVSSLMVRQTFGYSFTTWRFHFRGESIRGAHDVGYIRNLVVRRIMRNDVKAASLPVSIGALQKAFPLGSAKQIEVRKTLKL